LGNKRVDANQTELVALYRKLGCSVVSLAAVGAGVPDLLIGCNGITDLAEVKDGDKPPSAQKLTPDQVRWHEKWAGSLRVVNSPDDVIEHVAQLRGQRRISRTDDEIDLTKLF
jgi:Holliday junction resolvase